MVNPSKIFADADLSDAVFRETDLSRARMYGVLLTGANLDGDITGLVVNGVEVAPLIEAELDRRHPERIALRATTPEGLRAAVWTHTPRRGFHPESYEEVCVWSTVARSRHHCHSGRRLRRAN